MTKKQMIEIIQEQEARIWRLQQHFEKCSDRGGFYKEHKKELYKNALSEWNAISDLMEKLEIKSKEESDLWKN